MIPKKVKIVATLGPASDDPEVIIQLGKAGVNVFRINLSHATDEQILRLISYIKEAEKKLKRPIGILGDLAGPKIRINEIENGTILQKGNKILISTNPIMGNEKQFSINHPSLIPQLKKDAEVFIDDGKIKLVITKESRTNVEAEVLVGGHLHSKKGFNAQGISLSSQGISEKDKKDLNFVVNAGVDFIAISFVQSENDVRLIRKMLPENCQIKLIAKIETLRGTEEVESIIDASDGIMVARGDLGLAIPIEEIPFLQKKLIDMCLSKSKPVITATQMLESMTTHPIPTRAEITDVANAILDGTDAVMLSAETASGRFPVETVETMSRIIRYAMPQVQSRVFETNKSIEYAVSGSVGNLANYLKTKMIIAFTESGSTARRIARFRNSQVVFALTPNISTWRNLNLTAGVYSFFIEPTRDLDHMVTQVRELVKNNPVIKLEKGEPIVIVSGMPFGKSGATNTIHVIKV